MVLAQCFCDAMREPLLCKNQPVFLTASIGVAHSRMGCGASAEQLLRQARQALREAQSGGGNRCAVFAPVMQKQIQTWMRIEQNLRRALAAQEFDLVFQPIVSFVTGKIHSVEALLRWQHSARGTLSPADFLAVAHCCPG